MPPSATDESKGYSKVGSSVPNRNAIGFAFPLLQGAYPGIRGLVDESLSSPRLEFRSAIGFT